MTAMLRMRRFGLNLPTARWRCGEVLPWIGFEGIPVGPILEVVDAALVDARDRRFRGQGVLADRINQLVRTRGIATGSVLAVAHVTAVAVRMAYAKTAHAHAGHQKVAANDQKDDQKPILR